MNLVLHLCVTTLIGVVSCNEAHAGNFMASSPCFSFQGQNILWPTGPQGMAGLSSGNPMSWFNHPFFGGGGCSGTPASKPGVIGAPIEASMSHGPSDNTPASSSIAPVSVPAVPISRPATVALQVPASVPVAEPAATSVEVPEVPTVHDVSIPHDTVSHHEESLHVESPDHLDDHPNAVPSVHVEHPVHVASSVLKEPDHEELHHDVSLDNEPVHVDSLPKESVHVESHLEEPIHVEPHHEEPIHVESHHEEPAHIVPHIEKDSHELHHDDIDKDITAPGADIHLDHATKNVDLHAGASAISPKIIVHDDSASISSEEVHPLVKIPVIHEEASLCNMPSEPLPHIPCLNATIVPSPVDSCNITCPIPPAIDPLSCHHDITPLVSIPLVETCNFTLPPLVDACNITCHNISDLDPISCHDSWHSCDFPGGHPLFNECPNIPCDIGFDGCHGIYPNSILDHHPHIYNDHFHTHHFDSHPCFNDPGYETKILPPISYLNITDPNEVNLTDIQNCLPSTSKIITDPLDLKCARHNIVTEVKPVIDECITCIPIIKNRIKQKEETFTRHIPIVTNHISTREEKRLCHIPIVNQRTHNVIEHQHDHIPITQSHLVPIVQPYVEQVPITRRYIRPIVESSVSHVPIVETCVKPVIHHSVNTIPITEKRITPTFHQEIVQVPIRESIPHYGYCDTHHAQPHYAAHTLPSTGSIEQLNYPGLRNSYITEGPIENYAEASNPEPSYRYADQSGQPSLISNEGSVEDGVVNRDPEYDQTLNDFRRNLYLPSVSINNQAEGFGRHQEASLPAAPEEFTNNVSGDEGPYVHEGRGYDQTGLAEGLPVGESQDYYQGSNAVQEGEPEPSPLSQIIPFPQGSAEEVTDRSAGYHGHSDYCD